MVAAIGSSYTPVVQSSSVASTAGLEAQIARDEKELSNCVNCASAETKQGQADIQALTNKINTAKVRLEQLNSSASTEQTTALNSATTSEVKAGELTEETSTAGSTVQTSNIASSTQNYPAQNTAVSSVGRRVDEYV